MAGIFSQSTMRRDCVPFPQPGGPNKSKTIQKSPKRLFSLISGWTSDNSVVNVVILGCGYTGSRVAERFLDRLPDTRPAVWAGSRHVAEMAGLASRGANVFRFEAEGSDAIPIPDGALVLHSVPVVEGKEGPRELTPEMIGRFSGTPSRVVYLSTTGVYGAQHDVDETTLPAPRTEREAMRVRAEEAIRSGTWSSLILRPAAIYGPGRGVHVAMQQGRFQLAGDGSNFVSRIHVDDLATHVEAALTSEVTGAYPIGDELPCTSREIAEFCAKLLDLPVPPEAPRDSLHETRRADRRVDGRAIRKRLGIALRYPTYREGILASL